MRRNRSIGCAAVLALTLTMFGLAAPQAGAAPLTESPTRFDKARHGNDAADHLGAEAAAIAAKNGMTEGELRQRLAADQSLWIDPSGRALYVDPPLAADQAAAAAGAAPVPEAGHYPYTETFLLHSKPGSSRTIYLDFNGEQITGTAWNNNLQFGTATPDSFFADAFDLDGDGTTFNNTEQDMIQSIWQRVSEDYSVFDVDVTTQDPGVAAIDRTDANDQVYGTRALITNTTVIEDQCSCGGIAYIGVYGIYATATTQSHGYYQPALIFQRGLAGVNTDAKFLGEAASHEVGHNLGLHHDGTATAAYYSGQGAWAPIMGNGYYLPITQFSKGEYAGANNAEDDFAVIQANGLALKADDYGDTMGTATTLALGGPAIPGVITTAADVDYFKVTTTGAASVVASTASTSPDLDIRLDLYDSSGNLQAFADNPATFYDYDTAPGLTAILTIPNAGTWYLKLDGVGVGNPLDTGYSDYGSVGQYTILATSSLVPQGLLRVTTTPAVPSQIIVDGTPRDTWGLTWMKISVGNHQVCFRDVGGFITPACQTVDVGGGGTATVTGTFIQRGTLRVTTSPAVASTISVDGVPRNDWGIWTDLDTGSHQVCFGAVVGYTAPACQNVTVNAGATTTATGTFVANAAAVGPTGLGTLKVTTSPALPSQILVDGIVRDTWGAWFKIAPGSHQVCFTGLEGYTTPTCQTVTVNADATTTVTGTFAQRGFLRVLTNPASVGTIFVNSLPRNDWGMWTDLPAGAVTVCFGLVAGKTTPLCQNANVVAGATTTLTGTYS